MSKKEKSQFFSSERKFSLRFDANTRHRRNRPAFPWNNEKVRGYTKVKNMAESSVSEDRDTIFKRYIECSTFGRVHKLLSLLFEAIFLDLVNGGVVSFRPFNEMSNFGVRDD